MKYYIYTYTVHIVELLHWTRDFYPVLFYDLIMWLVSRTNIVYFVLLIFYRLLACSGTKHVSFQIWKIAATGVYVS